MPYEIERTDEDVLLRFQGVLDTAGCDELSDAFYEIELGALPQLTLDLASVPFMASSGLGAIVGCYNRLKDRGVTMKLVRVQESVHKVFVVMGLAKMLTMSQRTDDVNEVISADDTHTDQALASLQPFLRGALDSLDVPSEQVEHAISAMADVLATGQERSAMTEPLRAIFGPLGLNSKIAERMTSWMQTRCDQIKPHLLGTGPVLQAYCGLGVLAASLASQREVQACDTANQHTADVPFVLQDGDTLPFADNAFDCVIVVDGLHRSGDPVRAIRELKRVAKLRVVVVESVCLNEAQRRFNVLTQWLYGEVLEQASPPESLHFNSPKNWEWMFRDEKLRVRASVDLGIDEPIVPNYHWMFVLDV